MATHAMSTALPTPDPALTAALQAVMDNLGAVEVSCPGLGPASSAGVRQQVDDHLSAARGQLDAAKRILGGG